MNSAQADIISYEDSLGCKDIQDSTSKKIIWKRSW
jgi:hypothetical protein